jgi:hypothetical protein
MSELSVVTAAVADAGVRLAAVSPGIDEVHGRICGCSGAAAGTHAEGAVEALLSHWATVLPHFGLAGDRLANAVSVAAQGYELSDAAIGGAAAAGARAAAGGNPHAGGEAPA